MSSSAAQVNALLDAYLFQVIGSTPVSVKEELVNSGLEGNSSAGAQLTSICLLASATVKRVVEEVLLKPEFAEARRIVTKSLSINGKVNMSALTLIGHCLLTSSAVDDVHFAKASRARLGQRHLWDGDLAYGQLSDQQRKIMAERRKNIGYDDASAFGGGFFKFFGMSRVPYTTTEAAFWGIRTLLSSSSTTRGTPSSSDIFSKYGRSATPEVAESSQTSSVARPSSLLVTESSPAKIPANVVEYCQRALKWDVQRIEAEANKQGISAFNSKIEAALKKDPKMEGIKGKSVVS